MAARKIRSPADLIRWTNSGLLALSVAALVTMMAVTFVSVVMRYLFNVPLLGNNEIVQLMAVSLAMLAMPYATQTDAHVRVDILDARIGRYGRFFGDILSRCLAGYVLTVLTYRAWLKMLDAARYGDATNMLQIPIWPFYGLIVAGMTLYVLVLGLQLLELLKAGPRHDL